MGRVFPSIFLHPRRAHFIEELLDATAVFQRPFEHGHHGGGYVKATPPPLVGEGQQVVGVFFAAGASAAVWPDAGLMHQGQRAFESRPAALELTPKAPLHTGGEFFLLHTAEYSR